MPMKKIIFFFSLSIILLYSCNKDDNIVPDPDYDIRIEALYIPDQNPNKTYPDVGAMVYIYYGFDGNIFTFSDYKGNGEFIYEKTVYKPDQTFEVGKDGKLIITPLNLNEEITIVVQSKMYEELLSTDYYPSAKRKIDLKIKFHQP